MITCTWNTPVNEKCNQILKVSKHLTKYLPVLLRSWIQPSHPQKLHNLHNLLVTQTLVDGRWKLHFKTFQIYKFLSYTNSECLHIVFLLQRIFCKLCLEILFKSRLDHTNKWKICNKTWTMYILCTICFLTITIFKSGFFSALKFCRCCFSQSYWCYRVLAAVWGNIHQDLKPLRL